jgi:hypothetical protein
MSRTIFYRESSSKMYSQLAFVVSIVVAEVPYSILCGSAVLPIPLNLRLIKVLYRILLPRRLQS